MRAVAAPALQDAHVIGAFERRRVRPGQEVAWNATNLTLTGNVVTRQLDQWSAALRFEGGVFNATIQNNTVTQVYLTDDDVDAIKAHIDRLQLIGTLMEKQSRVASWICRFRLASMPLAVSRRAEVFTRLYDFDVSGANTVFGSYSWERDRPASDTRWQLPGPGWVRHRKPPGTITDRISINKTGDDARDRLLRIG